jgi:AcrR family transcriptional regulator
MTTPSKQRGNTREQLLDAACQLMIERDSLDISLADIATRASANAALVRYYFGNKEGMLVALLERDARGTIVQLQRLMAMDLPPAEKMRRHLIGVMRSCFQRPYINRLVVAVLKDQTPDRAREMAESLIRPLTDSYKQMVAEGVAAGAFRPVDPMMLYFQAIGICENLFASRVILPTIFGIDALDGEQRERFIEQMLTVFMTGLLEPSARL